MSWRWVFSRSYIKFYYDNTISKNTLYTSSKFYKLGGLFLNQKLSTKKIQGTELN